MIIRSCTEMSSRPSNFSHLLGCNWKSKIRGDTPFKILLDLSFISFSPWNDYFMSFPFTSSIVLIFFHALPAVDFVSYFVERLNIMIRKVNRQMQPRSLLSLWFPGGGVLFQLEFIVMKFLRLSSWKERAIVKFVLEDKNQSKNKWEDNWAWNLTTET